MRHNKEILTLGEKYIIKDAICVREILLMYNPKSGNTYFNQELDLFIKTFNNKGYDVKIYRSSSKGKMNEYLTLTKALGSKCIIVSGGDGTVNEVINSMMNNNIKVPLGIIPAGTSNDFARYIKMPKDYEECFKVLANMKTETVDLGKVNSQYFINICCGGLFTNVSQNIDTDLKNTLGKMAYYIKGAEQIPNFKPFKVDIKTLDKKYSEELYLFLVLNSTGAGGFELIKDAEINDGYLDFIGVRSMSVLELPIILMKLLKGQHLEDKNVLYLRDKNFYIRSHDIEYAESDVDGEKGPDIPLKINVIPQALKIITNR